MTKKVEQTTATANARATADAGILRFAQNDDM
jgi:hypothetical protein